MGAALVFLMQTAFPAIIFIGLYCLGQIATPDTNIEHYSISLSIYLCLVYLLVSVQKKGISASSYHYYLATLPSTQKQRCWAKFSLLTLAGNVFLLAPAVIALFMINEGMQGSDSFWQEAQVQLLPISIATILTFYLAWIAATKRHIPIFSLVVYPILLVMFAENISKLFYLVIWMLFPLCEHHLKYTLKFKVSFSPKYYVHFLVLSDVANKVMGIARIASIFASAVIFNTVRENITPQTWPYLHLFSLLVISIIASTNQFDLIKLEQHYRYFIASTIKGSRFALWQNQLYYMAKHILLITTLVFLLPYNLLTALTLLGLITSSSWAIRKWASYFFLVPLALTCVLVSLSILNLIPW